MRVKINLIDGPSLISAGATKTSFDRLRAGSKLPPLYVKRRYNSDRLLLVDGTNRLAACKRVGMKEVEVEIV